MARTYGHRTYNAVAKNVKEEYRSKSRANRTNALAIIARDTDTWENADRKALLFNTKVESSNIWNWD